MVSEAARTPIVAQLRMAALRLACRAENVTALLRRQRFSGGGWRRHHQSNSCSNRLAGSPVQSKLEEPRNEQDTARGALMADFGADQLEAFRAEVDGWLTANYPAELRDPKAKT